MSLKSTNKVETNKVELEIEISPEDFENAIQKAYLKARKKIQLPGFRKGKAPRKLIEKEYGEGFFYEDAINELYTPEVNAALKEADLEIVTNPQGEVLSVDKEKGVSLKVTCITKPELEVENYKGIEVDKTVNAVTDEDVERETNNLKERNARMVTVDDRAAELGDDVVIDFEGFKDDVAFEGGKAEDFNLTLGSGQFIPGFEDAIVGHNSGESFDINVTFPEDYQEKSLAGAPAVFKINLKSISKKEVPELDDDLIKDTTEFNTVDEYKADIKKKLEDRAEKEADSLVEGKIFDKVIENSKGEIPQVMFDNRVNEMISELEQRLASQGISLELYLQYSGQTIDNLKKTYAEQAEKQVKLRLALEKVVKLENIEVSEEELNTEFDKIAEQYKMPVEQVKIYIRAEDLEKDIAVGKAVDLIKDSAVINNK
ncbi:MAG: trigger factor [Oscillospiraceae bacterium]